MSRKKVEEIQSLGNDIDKLTVQKSQPLFSLWRSELSLAEFKILDTYLSRINSHDKQKRIVTFEKGELEKLLGVKRILNDELDSRLKNLMTTIKIPHEDSKGFTRIALFEKAEAIQDKNGLWQIKLECTRSAMKYIFDIEKLGYLRYKLRCITSITSRYSYIMFLFLEYNRFRKSFEVDLEELKKVLNCDKEDTYKEYKRFNDLVLKKIHKELNKKTELKYDYEPIKQKRKVVAIRFTIQTLKDILIEENENQMTIEDFCQERDKDIWENALYDDKEQCEFSSAEIEAIREILVTIPTYKLPDMNLGVQIARYHYIRQKYTLMNTRKNIKHRFRYFCEMLKKDLKEG